MYEVVEHYFLTIDSFCRTLLKVLDCGTLATKVFIVMYQYRREWTCPELAREVGDHRQNVNKMLHRLKKEGFVERVSLHKWRIKI